MKKMWKRFVSLLLACTLLAGMLPLSASAAEKPTNNKWVQEKVEALNAELGDESHQYELDGWAPIPGSDLFAGFYTRSYFTADEGKVSTTVMFIAPGDGGSNFAMPDYSQVGDLWVDSGSVALYIANGVTEIGNHAFDGMSTLETIEFENSKSLTKVGEYAFNNCDKMVGLSLDLSNVTTLGKYAFNGCERLGSGENNKGVTLSDELTTIPENAFNTCGLKNVNIPKSCTKIEKNAFAHNSLSEVKELVLPDGLQTIGDSAFVVTMGSGTNEGIGITSLTIPSSVKSIGANAFSGRRNLAEVTVEDDNKPGTKLELGNHAFGYNESSAFSEWGSITDNRTGQIYEGTMGTKFYLPKDLVDTFENGVNCYTGDIEPMKWVKTQQPTCDTDGWHLYETTMKGAYDDEGNPLVLQYKYTIPMLGHDWNDGEPIPASCERNSYTLYTCKREGCGDTYSDNFGQDATGHEYTLISVTNPSMGNGQSTTFKWVCQKSGHDETRDGKPITVEISVSPSPISATTTTKYGELQLPKVNGGTLSLAADVNEDELLEIGDTSVHVVYTPDDVAYAGYTGMAPVDSFTGTDLTLQINVSKAKLDFSSVRFGNCLVGINPGEEETVPITIERGNLPEDVEAEAPVYTEHGSDKGSITPPSIGENWTGTVSVTFTYAPEKYEEKTKNLPNEYTYSQDPEAGTVTITHSYVVTKLEMTNVSATAIPDLAYTGSPMETVHVYGIPAGSTVSWEWESTTDSSVTGTGLVENESLPNLQIAEITNAGTYDVTITITNKSYETYTLPNPVTVTIQKAKVETPKPKKDLVYTSHELIGLDSPDENAKYSYQKGSELVGTNAGTYTATAVLADTANYEWAESDNDGDGAVTISWNIAKRPVIETSITEAFKNVRYDGTVKRAVSEPTNATNFFTVSYVNGTLIGKVASNQDKDAFTIMHAEETNAGTYDVTATITDFENFYWQNHAQEESYSLGSWTINALQIAAPTITAEDATYTGAPYAGEVALAHSNSSSGIINLDATTISYYAGPNDETALENTPVNAGNYYAGVENWAFEDGKLGSNYQIIVRGEARDGFTITKAPATMKFEKEKQEETYTAQGTDLQQVKVTNLVTADEDKPASEVYTVTYTYKYKADDKTNWEEVKTETKIEEPSSFKFTKVGEYKITAKFTSNNYTATDATYTLTITQAEDQSITLTSADANEGTWELTEKTYTTIYGSEKTFTVTGTAALDNASISYAVNGDSNVVSVDGSSGVVTIHKAGTATITVTAAETPNVGAASVDYTVTVKKAEPTVNTGLEGDELTVAYTGKAIEGYDKATPTANVVEGADQPFGDITYTFYTDSGCSDENKVTNGGGKDGNIPIAVGTYYMKATYSGDENYLPAESEPVTVTVTKAQLTVDAEGYEGTYNGKEHPAITIDSVTGNGTQLTEGEGYTVKYATTNTEAAPGEDAGDDVWKGTLTVKDVADSSSGSQYYWYMVTADNYNPAIGKVEVEITPAPLTVAGEPASYKKEYDGDNTVTDGLTGITVTAENVPDVTISVAATGTYADKNAGEEKDVTLTLSLSGTDGTEIKWGNYSYGGTALTEGKITLIKTDAGTITPKEITVTGISAENRVYDGTKVVQLAGTPGTTDFLADDSVNLKEISTEKGTVESADVETDKTVTVAAATLKGLLTGEDAKNYTVTQAYTTTVNITKRPVTLQFPNGNDGTTEMTAPYSPQGLIVAHSDVYKVSAKTADDSTGFVGEDALAENDIQYTFTQDEQTVEKPINVGKYTVNAALTSEAAEKWSNYTIKAITGTVEIIQATEELTVTVTGKTGLTYTGKGQDPIQSISVQGGSETLKEDEGYTVKFRLTDSGEYALDRNALTAAVKDAKEYTVYWQVTTTNYGNEIGNFTVTVDPATLTLSSSLTEEKKYNGTTVAAVTKGSVEGAQNSENITVSSVSAAYDNANVGTGKTITTTYKVTFGAGVTPGNYTYTGNVEGKATSTWTIKTTVSDGKITQAPVTVTISDQTSVYDGKEPTVGQEEGTEDEPKAWYVSTGEVFSQDTTKDDLGIILSIASGSKDAGAYAITGEWTNKNYDVTFTGSWTGGTAGTYTITPRPIKVEIGNAEGFYGDEPDKTKVELTDISEGNPDTGLVSGDSLDDFLSGVTIDATASTGVGNDYSIVGEAQKYGNYDVTFSSGTYTVKARPITITIADHSSKYGAAINGGIAKPVSGTDYTVAITGNATTGDAIVKGDNLEIKLTTKATADSPVDDYDITGSAEGNKVNNYAITWAGNGGNRDGGGKNGRYTIKPAQLDIAFTQGDQVTNGVSINITDSYKDNPLVLKNASTDTVVSAADKESLAITYSIAAAGENGGDTDVATINAETGEVTIHSTGTVRVTAKVTANKGSNYTGTQTTWYELNIIGGGQMALKVTPKTNLTYTGDPQALIETPICSLDSAEIHYSLNNRDWGDEIPTGTNAGTYTVYVKATDPNSQYSDVTEHVTVTIDKADLKGSFAHNPYPHVLATDGNNYDSATANPLDLSANQNYTGNADAYTYRSDNMDVAIAVNGGSTIRVLGSAGDTADITVTVPGDNNYNEGTFTYTLEISDDLSKIVYSVGNQEVTYNGQPQTIAVKVTAPASGATVMYQDEDGNYTLSEPPAYTDVKDSGTTIKFQITAPGYKTEEGTATLTIEPKKITETIIAGIAGSYTYTGKEITFDDAISLHDEGVLLKQDTDYTIDYGDNKEVGTGSVTITGMGNYTGSVTKNFEITPVDASDLTASLDRTFGYYGDSETKNATVTVTHGSHEVNEQSGDTVSVTVTQFNGAAANNEATVSGQTVTFNQVGTYTIEVTVTGNHATNAPIQLTYALLPVEEGELVLEADNETSIVATYGEPVNGDITVTDASDTPMTENIDYSLTYTYTPFEGTAQGSKPYDPSVMSGTPAAGMYVVTATGQGGYVNSVGTFTFLILQRDLAEADLMVEDSGLVYNQKAQMPSVTVTVDGNAQPTKDADYTITYYNNVNASVDGAKAVVTAKGNNFTGSNTENFSIAPKEITAEMVEDIPKQHYTGNAVIPPVTIKDSSYTLILGYDYTTACEDKGPGAATVTIKGTGNYTGEVEKTFTIQSEGAPEPSERFDLAVTPSQWTWGDDLTNLRLSVTFGEGTTLTLGTNYTLNVKGGEVDQNFTGGADEGSPVDFIKSLKPGTYTITATGVGAYNGSTDTETVTIQKIQPTVTVTATPNSLSGGGKVTLTLKGEKLPAFAKGEDLSDLLTVTVQNGQQAPDLTELEWTENPDGSLTAELTLPNTNETYTFALSFVGNDCYESASSNAMVVVGQQTSGGGGGSDPGDQPADPDDTGVSDWLNTKDHLAYLAGYPGGTFGPDQNMTRAEAAQMFYNLLLEKDVEITVEFEDVPADAWYAKPVNTLASLGILSGVGNGRFDPERSITRAEFTVIAMKFANTSGGGVNIFSDVNEDDWFYSAVVDSTQYGWINGYPDGTFRPEATISRAEVTVIVNHMLGRAADRPYVIAHEEELNTFGDVNRGHWGYFHIAEATNAHEYHTEDGTESWTGLS